MPKYFDGEQELPARVITFSDGIVDEIVLNKELLADGVETLVSIKMPGLPDSSLGYVFILKRDKDGIDMRDVKGDTLFQNITISDTISILKHSSGIAYSPEIQSKFYKIRNELGLDQ
jgi:hypothetical protein